jgi:hypothetical protein
VPALISIKDISGVWTYVLTCGSSRTSLNTARGARCSGGMWEQSASKDEDNADVVLHGRF